MGYELYILLGEQRSPTLTSMDRERNQRHISAALSSISG